MPSGSKPFVGSSNINNLGELSNACAIPSLCLIPNEYFETLSLILSSNLTSLTTSSIFSFVTSL